MPFDSNADKPDLTVPSLAGLAWALRHPEAWPRDFRWDFDTLLTDTSCGSQGCALGVAALLWPGRIIIDGYHQEESARNSFLFDIPLYQDYFDIFYRGGAPRRGPPSRISPADVADRIDSYLARR